MLLYILLVAASVVLLLVALINLYLTNAGIEKVVPKIAERTPFVIDEQTEDSVTISTTMDFINEGKQCATIMDAFVRPHLPYEQYDLIETRGHAELTTAPREDDYFEAYIVQAKGYKGGLDKATLKAQIKLTARHGMNIKEALAKLPDFNYLLIWLETGRRVAHYRQVRVPVLAQDIAKLAGVELVQD